MSINYENITNAYSTIGGKHKKVSKIFESINGTWQLKYEAFSGTKVTYNANGGMFDNNTSINNVYYTVTETIEEVTKVSKTSNVSDDGLTADTSNGYGNNQSITDIVTIEGAESLDVTITYQTESTSYDWVSVYDNSVTPSVSNYDSSISGKLGNNTKTTKTFTVNGDTVQIFFRSDSSVCNYYGYYATVSGAGKIESLNIVSGEIKDPSKAGYVFKGWYLDSNCTVGNEFDIYNSPVGSITVYAKWMDESDSILLQDFEYIENEDNTFTLTNWKGTFNDVESTELIIPDDCRIVL